MIYGIQIASFLFLITIVVNYFKHKRLPLQSTVFFTAFIIISIVSLLSEAFTLITINNDALVNTYLNRFAHQIFICSINLIILFLYLYIDLKCRKQRKYSPLEITLRLIPFIISFGFILFGDLKYSLDTNIRYSYGIMTYTIYISALLYIILTIIDLIRFRKDFSSSELISISLGLLSWASVTTIQFLNPQLLLSSLAIVLMVQFLYMSFENSAKYLVENDGCVFSKNAFELTVNEYLIKKKKFYIVNYSVSNIDTLSHEIGHENLYSLITGYANELSRTIKGTIFITKDYTISVILDDLVEYNKLINTRTDIASYNLDGKICKLKLIKKGVVASTYESFDDVVNTLEEKDDSLIVYLDNKTLSIQVKDIYYVEVIDNQTFIYTKKNCYESKDKLYQLEDTLVHWNIQRCSKSMLVNIQKIKSVAKESNSRLIAYLLNDESIIVSRQYVKDIKARLKI